MQLDPSIGSPNILFDENNSTREVSELLSICVRRDSSFAFELICEALIGNKLLLNVVISCDLIGQTRTQFYIPRDRLVKVMAFALVFHSFFA